MRLARRKVIINVDFQHDSNPLSKAIGNRQANVGLNHRLLGIFVPENYMALTLLKGFLISPLTKWWFTNRLLAIL